MSQKKYIFAPVIILTGVDRLKPKSQSYLPAPFLRKIIECGGGLKFQKATKEGSLKV
jgi:hypothetical protein